MVVGSLTRLLEAEILRLSLGSVKAAEPISVEQGFRERFVEG